MLTLGVVDDVNPLLPAGYDVVRGVVAALPLILSAVAFVGVVLSPRYTLGGKTLWIVTVVALPVLGAIAWLATGRTARLRRDLP